MSLTVFSKMWLCAGMWGNCILTPGGTGVRGYGGTGVLKRKTEYIRGGGGGGFY